LRLTRLTKFVPATINPLPAAAILAFIAGLVPLTAITHCELPVGDEPAGIFVPSQMIGLPNSGALDGSQ
jgi:hypothetical protein